MSEKQEYAVIACGGKQYQVESGQKLKVEKLAGENGSSVSIKEVLLLKSGDSSSIKVGTPYVDGASVTAKIVKQTRGPRTVTFKKKIKQGYTKKQGHRQDLSEILIESINS